MSDVAFYPALLLVRVNAFDQAEAEKALLVVVAALHAAGFSVLSEARAKLDDGTRVLLDLDE